MKKNTTRQKLSLTTKLFMCGAACYLAALFYNITQYENSMSSVSSSIGLVANEDATEKARRFEKYNYVPPVFRDNLAVKKEHEKVVEEKCGAGPEFTNYFSISPGWKERSRHNEDSILYNLFFKDRRIEDKGTFIEMGAYDGIQESNSRFFEYCLGWRGLLVEANPYEYPLLYKNRPHAHKMGFAPSCSLEEEKIGKTIMFHDIASTNAGLEGAATTYNGRHKVPVPCGSLTPVLLDLFPDSAHIHLFSLDVEGSEPSVLENIDFKKVYIEIIIVEVFNAMCNRYCKSRDQTRAIMGKEGYIRHGGVIAKSDIYVHPRSTAAKYTTNELKEKAQK